MRTKKVVVLPYDPTWKTAYETIRYEVLQAIDDLIIGIEHVGSTAVEGLSAKPCIDVDVIIRDYAALDAVISGLEAIGYIYEGNLGIPGREAFRYTDKPHLHQHHLYVCPQNSDELRRHIVFRDYLRSNPEAARKYGAVKRKAADLCPDDIDGYSSYKSGCIEEMYRICGLI